MGYSPSARKVTQRTDEVSSPFYTDSPAIAAYVNASDSDYYFFPVFHCLPVGSLHSFLVYISHLGSLYTEF
jgi:hypothetical protein